MKKAKILILVIALLITSTAACGNILPDGIEPPPSGSPQSPVLQSTQDIDNSVVDNYLRTLFFGDGSDDGFTVFLGFTIVFEGEQEDINLSDLSDFALEKDGIKTAIPSSYFENDIENLFVTRTGNTNYNIKFSSPLHEVGTYTLHFRYKGVGLISQSETIIPGYEPLAATSPPDSSTPATPPLTLSAPPAQTMPDFTDVSISLDKSSYEFGENIVVSLSGITEQMVGGSAFVQIVYAGASHDELYGGGKSGIGRNTGSFTITLTAPLAGSYEMRLYTYVLQPDGSTNVFTFVKSVPFTTTGEPAPEKPLLGPG
ncbi:MAG: hypothetical protein LBC96_01980 [Lachnospiraceae bacterium]|jgi:hypothetical protein|nr:hypothetical protein [Lachnospiraceae bacterium]